MCPDGVTVSSGWYVNAHTSNAFSATNARSRIDSLASRAGAPCPWAELAKAKNAARKNTRERVVAMTITY
jgi:hypothetical protein